MANIDRLIPHIIKWEAGTLVRDYIPVRKNGVGYLWNNVTEELYGNAGTGDFVLGPDVT